MKRFILFLAAAVMVSTVLAGFKYEGEWGSLGSGPGQFRNVYGVDVSPDGNVYVADCGNKRIQYFTPTGTYLGAWDSPPYTRETFDVVIAPNGNAYTGGCGYSTPWEPNYYYFTKSGSLLGSWICAVGHGPGGHGDIATDGTCYIGEFDYTGGVAVGYYTPTGSLIGSWYLSDDASVGVAVSPSSTVYVALDDLYYGHSIRRYTSSGSLLGSWGSTGSGNGQFRGVPDVDVGSGGPVFVADSGNNRVQYFTPTGSFLGKWGTRGTGAGEFNNPVAISVSPDGKRVYVADAGNNRIQYFVEDTSITPTSLGKVKALFR